MGFIDMFTKPSRYSYGSNYLNDRKRAMRDRVRKICQENDIEESCIEKEISLQDRINDHKLEEISSKSKIKISLVVFVSLALIAFLVYLLSNLF